MKTEENIVLLPLEVLATEVGNLAHRIEPLEQTVKNLGAFYSKYSGNAFWEISSEDRANHNIKYSSARERLDSLYQSTGYKAKKRWLGLLRQSEELGSNHSDTLRELPDFLEFIWDLDCEQSTNVASFTTDAENGIGVVLTDERSFGGPGTEYGVGVTAYRDGQTKREYFIVLPSTSHNSYDHLNFEEARIVEITDENFAVELTPRKGAKQNVLYSLRRIPKSERVLEQVLNEDEQEAFVTRVDTLKEELLKQHYRSNGLMPRELKYFESSGLTLPSDSTLAGRNLVPYDKPQIIDNYVQERKGVAVVVIKAQIDHDAGRGLEHEWVAYSITPTEEKVLDRKCAYQLDVQKGRGVSLNARELFYKHFKK